MLELAGYDIHETVCLGHRSNIYRGVCHADGCSVILKTNANPNSSAATLNRLRLEFELGRRVQNDHVSRYLALVPHASGLTLVEEDFGAVDLAVILTRQLPDMAAFLSVAMQLAAGLEAIHREGIIHKDIKPKNILVHEPSYRVKITDFGLSALIPEQTEPHPSPHSLQGSLAYLSPEQTGRTSRSVDVRSDLYSLGVTLYEMLAGRHPFVLDDPIELVHAHVARCPESPDTVSHRPIPEALCKIVLKLLAKIPEERYQSAMGLFADLKHCEQQLRSGGTIGCFPLGADDLNDRFRISENLYGREAELQVLSDVLKDAADAEARLVLCHGPAGVGKSFLIRELQGSVIMHRGLLASGKFDQLERGTAYSAVSEAFRSLFASILGMNPDTLDAYKSRIAAAVGPNGRVIAELVPELEILLGPQAQLAKLGATETRNRFQMVFQSLLAAVAEMGTLVLFFDDLQWADPASLELLSSVLTAKNTRNLVLIGAYRDREVTIGHPLLRMLSEVEQAGVRTVALQLKPLELQHTGDLVADTLHCEPARVRELAALVQERTLGNPLFVREFLTNLHVGGQVRYDREARRWEWDLSAIREIAVSRNVVELLIEFVGNMTAETQEALKLAACMGHTFDLHSLSIILESEPTQTARWLSQTLHVGIIVPLDESYRFFGVEGVEAKAGDVQVRYRFRHDRVQQAAYALIAEEQRRPLHLRIGRLMRHKLDADERRAQAVELVRHLNEGAALIDDVGEREELARLNLAAAQKAKASAAFQAAFGYLSMARELLPSEPWQETPELAFQVIQERSECAYLCGEFDQAEQGGEILLAHARTDLQKASVFQMRLVQYAVMGRVQEAIGSGLAGLDVLGLEVPEHPSADRVQAEAAHVRAMLGDRTIASLLDLPLADTPRVQLLQRLLMRLIPPAYMADNVQLFQLLVLKQVSLALQYGNVREMAYGYAAYGSLLGLGSGDFKAGFEFGQLGLALNDRFGDRELRSAVVNFYALFTHCWNRHWNTLSTYFDDAIASGLQSGDLFNAALAASHIVQWSPQLDLTASIEQGWEYLSLIETTRFQDVLDLARLVQGSRLNLRGLTKHRGSFSDDTFDEDVVVEKIQRIGFGTTLAIYNLRKLQNCLIFNDVTGAARHLERVDRYANTIAGMPYSIEHCIFGFLTVAGTLPELSEAAAAKARQRLEREYAQMQVWAEHCPVNFLHHQLLMEAELARLSDRFEEACRRYDQAAATAREQGYPLMEALTNELASRCFAERKLNRMAHVYADEARRGYAQWGATEKVHQLDEMAPVQRDLGGQPVSPPKDRRAVMPLSLTETFDSPHAGSSLDLLAIAKASQAISSEVNLERFLSTMMRIMVETAGAQKGFLFLRQENRFVIEAIVTLDADAFRVAVLQSTDVEAGEGFSRAIVRYVNQTGVAVTLGDAAHTGDYRRDPYISAHQSRSVLCMPVRRQDQELGVIYLSNDLVPDAFTPDRVRVLEILVAQAAISLETARLYDSLSREVLERQRTEQELKRHRDHLEELVEERSRELSAIHEALVKKERLATIGQLTATVSHELRNPMGTIRLSASVIRSAANHPTLEHLRPAFERLERNITRCDRIIGELLDYTRVTVLKRQPIVLDTWLASILDEQPVPAGVTLQRNLQLGELSLPIDPDRFHRAVLNVLTNAIDAVRNQQGDQVSVSTRANVDRVEIVIEDTGIGIPEDELDRVFEPLFSTKSFGIGLGMPTVKQILEAHGGGVDVESQPGQCTRVTLWLLQEEPESLMS